jgi:hypothetical protein
VYKPYRLDKDFQLYSTELYTLSHRRIVSLFLMCGTVVNKYKKQPFYSVARWTFNPAVLTKVQSPLVPSGGVVVGLPGAASPPSPLGVMGTGPIEPTIQACRYLTFLDAYRIPLGLKRPILRLEKNCLA